MSNALLQDLLTAGIAILVFGAALVATLFWLVYVAQSQRRRLQTRCPLELTNLGNVRSRYELQMVDRPPGNLEFQLVIPAGASADALPRASNINGNGSNRASAGPEEKPYVPAAPGKNLDGVRQAVGTATTSGSLLADVLYSIGQLLPGSLGSGIMSWSNRLYQTGYAARRVEQFSKRASDVRGKSAAASPNARGAASPQPAPPVASPQPGSPTPTLMGVDAKTGWVQTPYVKPGETLTLSLIIQPVRYTSQQKSYTFQVLSRSAEFNEAPQVVRQGHILLRGLSRLQLYLPWLVLAGIILAFSLWLWFWLISPLLFG